PAKGANRQPVINLNIYERYPGSETDCHRAPGIRRATNYGEFWQAPLQDVKLPATSLAGFQTGISATS
ncbi:hypothetical protein, partial [Pseudomonas sp. PM2]|uniref:hypothetical protein n=1 Tax=Pseudomonas sp. PM2 TaxID=215172 RepID=UPI003FA2EB01